MRSSKKAAGSGGAAIFHHHHNWVRKVLPKSWLTSFPVPASWNQDGGATSNVWRTSETTWNPQKGVVLVQKHPVDLWSYFFLLFEKHLMVSLPSHSWNGWGSCPLATTGKSISLQVSTSCSMKRGVDFGKHLLYFFLDFMFLFFVCTLKYSRIIVCRVQCHSRKEFGLTRNQPQPHYDHFVVFLDSIDQVTMTKQYEYEASLTASERCDVLDTE